jgi:EAL domain-containing protein (putative c-di-GMP-specific phosphodiesterase class I)
MQALLQDIQSAWACAIALDDFGTGYSNLAYLQRFPDFHAQDRPQLRAEPSEANRPLAELIVAMCRLMRLGVVAEGVETTEQLDWVHTHRIEQCQGYLFSHAVAAADFDTLLLEEDAVTGGTGAAPKHGDDDV